MNENSDKLNQLVHKMETLLRKQESFSREINELKNEINILKSSDTAEAHKIRKVSTDPKPEKEIEVGSFSSAPEGRKTSIPVSPSVSHQPKVKSDIEKFIGENLINKIGIAITVFGVAIGAKYAIDNQLISPLTRIILGYIFGLGLLGFAIRLKSNYENFSAVLLSGALAIMYFITFAAYDFYSLIPQMIAFLLMFSFTGFTVFAALNYNKEIIAHIGLVGAYAVPFLLSDGSGNVHILFTYMAIINTGILFISFKRYWRLLYYSSFIITWLIYFTWYFTKYEADAHFTMAFIFLVIFFTIFYVAFLAYKLIKKEQFDMEDVILLLINSFIFYGLGYTFLNDHKTGEQLLGLFTLGNAFIHFIVSVIIYRQKLADKNLFYLVAGLVLVFITIAIPVQLDGSWVTLLWAGEAALLFWIGRKKNISIYEKLSYYLMILAFLSIAEDWMNFYYAYNYINSKKIMTPLLNIHFLTSFLFISAFGFINYINRKYINTDFSVKGIYSYLNYLIPAIFLFTLYYAFRLEISHYWNQLHYSSAIEVNSTEFIGSYRNYDLLAFKSIWIINYSLLFLAALILINTYKIKSQELGFVNLILSLITIFVFLTQGLLVLSELRESYLNQTLAEFFDHGVFNIGIRYISYGCLIILFISSYKYLQQKFQERDYSIYFDLILHGSILWIASSELINWMNISQSAQSYKLGLSILWGLYCLFLIAFGIWKNKKHLRIGGIIMFSVTLIKLFFYDIAHLDTIAKTVVFVSLGILLLIISFLYNKYKLLISDDIES